MAATSATPGIAQALPPAAVQPSVGGRARVLGLRLAAAWQRSRAGRFAWPAAALGTFASVYCLGAVAHELVVLMAALGLPLVTGIPALQDAIAGLPVNVVYASAMLRYAGQIEAAGLALGGGLGVDLADRWPSLFHDPSFVAGDGFVSAVLAPGSSLLARTLASTLANMLVLVAGLALSVAALRGAPVRHLARLRGDRLVALAAGVALQVEVAARVARSPGSARDLETLGIVPFLLHEVLRVRREVYDLVMYQLARFFDPVFGEVVLVGLIGGLVFAFVAVRVGVRTAQHGYAFACGRRTWHEPWLGGCARLAAEAGMVAVLIAMLPIWDNISPQSRFLELEALVSNDPAFAVSAAAVGTVPVAPPAASVAEREPMVPPVDPAVSVPPAPAVLPPPAAAAAEAAPPAGARLAPLPPLKRPTVVAIGGRGLTYTYTVDGTPTEFRGMGYNVTYVDLPPADRAERLRRDFALMRQVGINVVVGWRTSEWDEAVLDAAQAAGVGVVMPFELDDKLDYSDRAVRARLRSEVLAWVARYRQHPAIRMWGIGNEALLHVKQPARIRAFAEFYAGLVNLVRQFDPGHPVMYREAEDVYVRALQEGWGKAGPPPGFVLGMNFYTFRMKEALAAWPSRGMDVPLVVSEFAPAGLGRGERAAGYWKMWTIIRARPEQVLGAAPYVWNAEGPEPVDRLFGLTVDAKPVDSTLGTLRDLYQAASLPRDEAAPIAAPALVGMPEATAEQVTTGLGLVVGAVTYQRAQDMTDPSPVWRYGIGNVIQQEPTPGTPLPRGQALRIVVAAAPLQPELSKVAVPD